MMPLGTGGQDAFIAPDARTLEATLQGIIDQGADEGEFSAQQSITESIFEYVDLASDSENTYAANIPSSRFSAIVPTRIISSFTMPGFRGRLRAIQNDGFDNPVEKWDAGEILRDHVANDDYGMGTCDTSSRGGGVGECTFDQLHAGETETSMMLSIRPDLVDMAKAVREMPLFSDGADKGAGPEADRPFVWGGEWWSAISESGVVGDPTVATREKGKLLLENAVAALVKIIKAARKWKIRKRVDHH